MTEMLPESSYYLPDSPKRYPRGRKCTMGVKCQTKAHLGDVGTVSQYTEPHQEEGNRQDLILFCPMCENERRRRNLDPEEFQGVIKKGQTKTYALDNLGFYRALRGLEQKQLAEMTGCNRNTIRKLERGEMRASAETLRKMCQALQVRQSELRGLA